MNSPSLPWILLALLAGVLGGVLGGFAGGMVWRCEGDEASAAFRPLSEERQLIAARGDWQLRQAVTQVQPIVLQLGTEALVYIPRIHAKRGQKFEVDFEFFRLEDGGLVRMPVTDPE